MHIYLPIAQTSLNVLVLIGLGAAVGVLSGIFGIGGGFIITPMLMFLGIPPEIAAATGANQVVGTSVTGALAQWQRRNIDLRLGGVLVCGGLVGSAIGVATFGAMRALGHIDLFISLTYVLVLGIVGSLMLIEGIRAWRQAEKGMPKPARRAGQHGWIVGLPFKMRFRQARLYVSIIPPALLGLLVGWLSAVMGVGGGFILVPAMIYLLRVPIRIVIGTSVLHVAAISAFNTLLHATFSNTVDGLLALLLLLGGVLGAEVGVRTGQRMKAEHLRAALGLLVLGMSLRLAADLVFKPAELYSMMPAF